VFKLVLIMSLVFLVPVFLSWVSDFAEFLRVYGVLLANVINIFLPCKMYLDTLSKAIDPNTNHQGTKWKIQRFLLIDTIRKRSLIEGQEIRGFFWSKFFVVALCLWTGLMSAISIGD